VLTSEVNVSYSPPQLKKFVQGKPAFTNATQTYPGTIDMKWILLAALLSLSSNARATDAKPDAKPEAAIALECILGGNPVSYPADMDQGKIVLIHWQENEQEVQKLFFKESGLDYKVKFSSGRVWNGPIDKYDSSCEYWMEFTLSIEQNGVSIASSYNQPRWAGDFTLNPPAPAAGMACSVVGGAKRFWSKKPSCKTAQ
jgi:hypothetical protein